MQSERRLKATAWAALAFVHRWLGIGGALLFLLWFVSGIAMMYVRMPELPEHERFERAARIPLDALRVPLADARAAAGSSSSALEIAMLGTRPVYRFGGPRPVTVFADRLERFSGLDATFASALARMFSLESGPPVPAGVLDGPDQWTLQLRPHLPLYRFTLGDTAGSEIYLSSLTGEVVMRTTRRERLLAYIGPVAHWLYLPVIRRNGALWTNVIVWSSSIGCVLCLTGLLAGAIRFAPFRPYGMRSGTSRSPYAGWMKWHHYAGLIFGVITFTWTFSGLLSMDPFPFLSGPGLDAAQRQAVTGSTREGPDDETLRRAIGAISERIVPKEMRLIWFRGEPYWMASQNEERRILISARHPEAGIFERFGAADLEAAARAASPGGAIPILSWLDDYDSYYYARDRALPLPVLRAQYADGTWLYLDPRRGAISAVMQPADRVNRWLYHGFHSLDPAWLRTRRPAWDLTVIALSLGGIAGVATSLVPAWRRLRRVAFSAMRRRMSA